MSARVKIIKESLKDSEIPQEAQNTALLGALMGVSNDNIIKGLVSMTDNITTKKANSKTRKRKKPNYSTQTESIIHDMLVENTGVSMMDSGGDYGRSWQRNRAIADFRNQPVIEFTSYSNGDIDGITKSLFHFLVNHLEYDSKKTYNFKRYSMRAENKEKSWYELIDQYAQEFNEPDWYLCETPRSENTYNGDNCLSQDIQYTIFHQDEIYYIILEIHGGADIRGGYTEPKIFQIPEADYFMMDMTRIALSCQCGYCDSDNAGYSWGDSDLDCEFDESGFPKIWNWSDRLKGVYCQVCKDRI